MQVAGNNMANASTPGYSRQVARMTTTIPETYGNRGSIGTGTQISRILRTVDTALQGRMRSAISDEQSAAIDQRFLLAIESVRNELGDANLSSRLNAFFTSFSELANNPNEEALRSVVVQQASGLASAIRDMRTNHLEVRTEIDRSLQTAVRAVDELLTQAESADAVEEDNQKLPENIARGEKLASKMERAIEELEARAREREEKGALAAARHREKEERMHWQRQCRT
jgi:flagellar hook-associated protein 1 FlgK